MNHAGEDSTTAARQTAAQADSFGFNVGRFEDAFPDWRLSAAFEGLGFAARRLVNGRRAGPAVTALTLDELAVLLDKAARPQSSHPQASVPAERPAR